MSTESITTPLQFGVELELLLRPSERCLDQLVDVLQFDNSAEAHLHDLQSAHVFDENGPDYTKWTIGGDPSIREHGLDYGVEFSSPIYMAMDVMTWEEEISRLFTCISEWFEIVTDDASGCATHVHIGKASAPEFDLDEIRKLSRGVFLFQDSISVEEPFDEYSRIVPLPLSHFSNVQNYSREEVLAAMNPPMPPTNLGSEAEWDPKFVALNFLSLNTLGTIEYRQGKYSRTAHDACQWVTLALAAVHVFLENDLDVAHAEVGQGVLRISCRERLAQSPENLAATDIMPSLRARGFVWGLSAIIF
ncbi:hypothetical protein MY11210_007949 [Beauveria gryllotalpidicola]